jgi:hypothetical protein
MQVIKIRNFKMSQIRLSHHTEYEYVLMLTCVLLGIDRQTVEELAISGIHALYNGGSCTVGAATEQIGLAVML